MMHAVSNSVPEPFFDLEAVRVMARKWSIDCGTRVAKRRESFGWTRAQLAQLCGTTEATIHRVESGALAPRDYLKMAIAAALAEKVEVLWAYPTREAVFAGAAA